MWQMTDEGQSVGKIGNFIRDIGFPIFVAVWLLTRITPTLGVMTDSFKEMNTSFNTIAKTQDQISVTQVQILEMQQQILQLLINQRR